MNHTWSSSVRGRCGHVASSGTLPTMAYLHLANGGRVEEVEEAEDAGEVCGNSFSN